MTLRRPSIASIDDATADFLREKAAQCRRLAAGIANQADPTAIALLALAVDFEARAVASTAELVAERTIDQVKAQEAPGSRPPKERGS